MKLPLPYLENQSTPTCDVSNAQITVESVAEYGAEMVMSLKINSVRLIGRFEARVNRLVSLSLDCETFLYIF